MAQRRMFSPDIVDSDAFLDMPVSSQLLYFHLAMRADDDGFVNPKKVMRIVNSGDDDLKVLLSKRFILPFESGVVVIKHWLIHNLIRADLYKETLYKDEKKLLGLNKNGAYTELRDGVDTIKEIEAPEWLKRRRGSVRTASVPQTVLRIGKVRLGKDRKDTYALEVLFPMFWEHYPNKTSKKKAEQIWERIFQGKTKEEADILFPKIFDGLTRAVVSSQWQKDGGQFIPHPTTWLNQERWDDEVKTLPTNKTIKI